MMNFTHAHDRLLKVKAENPQASWPEVLIRRLEHRAMISEVHRANAALRAREV